MWGLVRVRGADEYHHLYLRQHHAPPEHQPIGEAWALTGQTFVHTVFTCGKEALILWKAMLKLMMMRDMKLIHIFTW